MWLKSVTPAYVSLPAVAHHHLDEESKASMTNTVCTDIVKDDVMDEFLSTHTSRFLISSPVAVWKYSNPLKPQKQHEVGKAKSSLSVLAALV